MSRYNTEVDRRVWEAGIVIENFGRDLAGRGKAIA